MADEPSNGELWRLIEAMRGDVHNNLGQINARLDRLVSAEVYAVEKAAMGKDIADLSKDLEQLAAKEERDVAAIIEQRSRDADRVTQTRRYLMASVISLLAIVVPVILFMAGGK